MDGWMDDRVENGWRNGGIASSKELTFTCPCRSINVEPVGQAILPANSSFHTAVEQEPLGRVSWRKQQETSWTWSRCHTLGSGSFLCLNRDNQPYVAVLLFTECMTNKGGDSKATV